MLSKLHFAAFSGSFQQVAFVQPHVSLFAYHLEGLRLDSRLLTMDSSSDRNGIVVNATVGGEVHWLGRRPLREVPGSGTVASYENYCRPAHGFARCTSLSVSGLSLVIRSAIPSEGPYELGSPLPGAARVFEHMIERAEDSDVGLLHAHIESWFRSLENRGVIAPPPAIARRSVRRGTPSLVRGVTDILARPHSRPKLSDLAQRAGWSTRHVSRELPDVLPGMGSESRNFREVAHQWRLHVAGILLASFPERSIASLAMESGFSSASALNRALANAGASSAGRLRQRSSVDW